MFQQILKARTGPVLTPEMLASFGRFDVPANPSNDYSLLQLFIAAATDQVEVMAAQACLDEQVLLTLDFFPNTQDPRNWLQYELTYAFAITPWWWWGFPTKDSIHLVRRPVYVPSMADTPAPITAVSVVDDIATITCANGFQPGDVVVLAGTAEGNTASPQATPSTTPFLNGALLTVATATGTQFTAPFVFSGSYSNNSDTGTATKVTHPVLITYYDQNGVLQTWNSTNYFVQYDKVVLTVGNWWPLTDRRQDCIQISYWAGRSANDPTQVPSQLQMAILFLANHFWEARSIVAVEDTQEIKHTLCLMLSSFRTLRVPR